MEPILVSKDAIIDVHGVDVAFEDLSIRSGDFVLIQGPNGYGKSSFLKMLVGKDISVKVKDGAISFPYLFGEKAMNDYSGLEKGRLRNAIAYVPQEDDFFPTNSIFSAIFNKLKLEIENSQELSSKQKKEKKKECRAKVEEYLSIFNKSGLFKEENQRSIFKNPHLRSIYSCSGGQRKMCQIATALIQAQVLGSKLILMDEPLNNLDKNNKKILNNEIRDLMKMEEPPAILMVTHCHIFFGVNKEIRFLEEEGKRLARYVDLKEDSMLTKCLVDGKETDGRYSLE